MKTFPYFCSHSRRLRSVQMLTSPSLDKMLFRNHSRDTVGLQGQEPPQQHGWDRQNRADKHRPTRGWSEQQLGSWTWDCSQAPCCLQPTATTPVLVTWGTEAAGWNSLTTPTRVGLAVHDTAVLTLPNTRIRGVTTAVWSGMLPLQLGMELHITNLSDPRGNTSYLEQSSLISEPKL